MFPSLQSFGEEALIAMADRHDDCAFATLLAGNPEFVRDGEYCELFTGLDCPFANMAFGLDVPDAAMKVSSLTSRLKAAGVPGLWWVGPLTQPTVLGEYLKAEGWSDPAPVPAMVVDLDSLPKDVGPEGLRLEQVTSEEQLAIWHETMASGYDLPLPVAQIFRFSPDLRAFTAFLGDEPVGTTALFCSEGVAGIYSVSTVPEFRGRGIGAAVTTKPLLMARGDGYRVGTLQASSMGYPVYKRLGFQDVCTLSVYEFTP